MGRTRTEKYFALRHNIEEEIGDKFPFAYDSSGNYWLDKIPEESRELVTDLFIEVKDFLDFNDIDPDKFHIWNLVVADDGLLHINYTLSAGDDYSLLRVFRRIIDNYTKLSMYIK